MGHRYIDLTGQKFGKLTAIRFVEVRHGNAYWEWLCDCGQKKVIYYGSVKNGDSSSCGCSKRYDRTGQKFGKLTAIRFVEIRKGHAYWEWLCDCGQTKVIQSGNVKSGDTSSCGCLGTLLQREAHLESYALQKPKIKRYRGQAKHRDISFSLSEEQFNALISLPCTYCGAPPWSGIDRMDSLKGYELGNVVPCCTFCNKSKGTASVKEWGAHIRKIVIKHPEIIEGLDLQYCKQEEQPCTI